MKTISSNNTPQPKFTIIAGEDTIKVFDTAHSIERFQQRLLTDEMSDSDVHKMEWAIYSMLVSIGPNLLDAKNHEVFGIYDSLTQIGLIVELSSEFTSNDLEIGLEIITVCKTKNFFVRQGQRIFDVDKLLETA